MKIFQKILLLLGFALVLGGFVSPSNVAKAQFSLLPKLDRPEAGATKNGSTFYERECAKYADCGQISDTKLCSRIFKKVENQGCRVDNTVELFGDPNNKNIKDADDCKIVGGVLVESYRYDKKQENDIKKKIAARDNDTESYLACAMISGNIKLWMMPYYVRYMADFVISIAGPITIIIIIIGGYVYITGSLGGEGEGAAKGKKIILAGVLGLVLIFSAWTIVNVLLAVLTG